MKILLLGGTGTISHEVVTESLNIGCNVTIMNRGSHNEQVPRNVKIIVADFYNTTQVSEALENESYDVVVDFLSRRKDDVVRVFPVLGVKCKQYIFISTACVYDRDNNTTPFKESSSMPDLRWRYSVEKYECEQALMLLSSQRDMPAYTIVRPYITYDIERIPLGLSPASYRKHRTIIERIKSGKPMFVTNNGKTKTTITSSRDFARAFVRLYLNEKALNEDYSLMSSFVYTNKEILQIIFDTLGIKQNIVEVDDNKLLKVFPQYREMYVADRKYDEVFDNSKLLAAIGRDFQFEDKFENVFKKTADYYSQLNIYEYDYGFDALCDKLLQDKDNNRLSYTPYPFSSKKSKWVYLMFKYLPFKYAKAINERLI